MGVFLHATSKHSSRLKVSSWGEMFSSTCHSASGSACVTCLLGSLLLLPISVLAGGLEGPSSFWDVVCLPLSCRSDPRNAGTCLDPTVHAGAALDVLQEL